MAKDDFLNPDENLDLTADDNTQDNLVLNLEDAKETTFEALPPGVYNCVIENVEFGNSSNGNPMLTWVFKVTDPLYEGRFLYNHTTLNNDVGLGRLKKLLTRVLPDIDISEFKPRQFCDEGSALGSPCRVKVRVRMYQGEKRNNVQDVLPPQESGSSFLDE